MIRDEAIKRLKRFDLIGSNEDIEFQEALDMAIKALERKPHEKFESTKDHIYKLASDYKCWDNRLTQDEALELCHILEQEPHDCISRQMGKWILSGGYWRCSECKEKALLKLDRATGGCREYVPIKSNFCPNCGRKMEGVY